MMTFRSGFFAGLVIAAIWAIYLVRLWQPARQVELHTTHLLENVQNRNWKTVGQFIHPEYHDQWGNDRALLLERLPQVFRLLSDPRIESNQPSFRREEGRAYWTAKITLHASGELADFVQGRVNGLETPFKFEWQPGATWPWDWKLVSVRNSSLELGDYAP